MILSGCFKEKKAGQKEEGETNPIISEVEVKGKPDNKKYFSNVEDFKKFISRKWIALIGDDPCGSFKRTIKFENDFLYEYDGMEPVDYKIEDIRLIDSKTLDIKIETGSNIDLVFRVEVLDLQKELVKWSANGEEYYEETRPYDVVCGSSDDYKESTVVSSSFTEKWKGFYQFTSVEEGEKNVELGQGKIYDLYVSLDSVNLKSYGYRHLRNRKSYAIEKEGCLFIYSQDTDEDLLLKLVVKNNQYIATSLIDKKGEFKVLKKN